MLKNHPVKIHPIGGYFPKDNDGFVVNPAKWENVSAKFQQLIYKLIENIPASEKEQLHSIYLRGSLPRIIDEKFIADIDLFALSAKKNMRWSYEKWALDLIHRVKKENDLKIKIEFASTSVDKDLKENYAQLAAIIKTQSVCIYGTDFSTNLPSYKPSKSLCLNYKWLAEDLKNALGENADLSTKKDCLKTLIRTGFEIVMERENEYTSDLYWCCQSFGKWYPNLKNQMMKALEMYLNAEQNEHSIDPFLKDFGNRIVKETLNSMY